MTIFVVCFGYFSRKDLLTVLWNEEWEDRPRLQGLLAHITRSFKFGISFYMIAMLFILFDIEVVFLYPVGVILNGADSVFVLVEILVFIALLLVALAYVWRRGALNWR